MIATIPVEFDKDSSTLKVNRVFAPEDGVDSDVKSLWVPISTGLSQNLGETEMCALRWYLDPDRQVYLLDTGSSRIAQRFGMLVQ